MGKGALGLPFEYRKRPEYFDALNAFDIKTNSLIESILKKHKVRTVLDLTCGTGSQVFFLAKQGYKITGADFSPALLKKARERARREKIDVRFIDGDMRKLKIGQFDAVITIANAVGHLTKAGFEKAMRNINQNLKPGGIYVFDILNLDAMTDKVVADLAIHTQKRVGDSQLHRIQCSTIDRKSGRFTSYETGFIQKNASKPIRINYQCSLQIYKAQELREMLTRNGFDTLGQYGMNGSKLIKHKTTDILTVARKK